MSDLTATGPVDYTAPPMTFQRHETDDELRAIPNPDALGIVPAFTPSTGGDEHGNA